MKHGPISATRFASVEYDRSYMRMPLNWRLRIWGPSVGGYGTLDGTSSRYATEAQAETAAAVWMATGVTPAFQNDAMRQDVAREIAA